jgi:2-phospho-L-lactate/phosphoenolpyruvate guanylyltransferase
MRSVHGEWVVVLPVKSLSRAKSRLRGAVPGVPHDRLVLGLLRDTVAAVLACPAVGGLLVVTNEPLAARAATGLGARAVPDVPDAGLNPAVAHGAAQAGAGPVAALTGDLPALRPAELAAALAAARSAAARSAATRSAAARSAAVGPGRAFVPDAAGTGTTMLTAPAGSDLAPRFGPGSAAAHAASGAAPLVGPWPSLRRDVDTPDDLAAAAALGLGSHTASLYGARMQGTVANFDPGARSGTVLLDDGTELPFPTAAFDASGLRLLRPGQRVRLERRDGEVTGLSLITMGRTG